MGLKSLQRISIPRVDKKETSQLSPDFIPVVIIHSTSLLIAIQYGRRLAPLRLKIVLNRILLFMAL